MPRSMRGVGTSGVVLVKPINPNKFDGQMAEFLIGQELLSIANDIELDYQLTTATWKHEVRFEKLIQLGPAGVEILVGTDDEIYRYVDLGTKRHKIFPKRAKALAFPSMFVPKSTPGALASGRGFSGGETIYRKYVNHPGTKPRKFSKNIEKMWRNKFKRRMEKTLTKISKLQGV